MTPDREGIRSRLALLAAVDARSSGVAGSGPAASGPAASGPAASGGGWVPDPPDPPADPPASPPADPPAEGVEPDDVGIRDRALASAVAAYTAAHGHPLEAEALGERPVIHRWATPARATVAAVVALVVLGGVVVARAAGQAPETLVAVDDAARVAPDPIELVEAFAEPVAADVVVHVVGQVLDPGVVTLPSGSRVADAIEAAGGAGPEADLAAVNLARLVVDGEQVWVPRPGEEVPVAPHAAAGGASGGGAMNLNTADVALLETLPGIGPVLAQRIVDWRTAHGRFSSVDELTEVSGIGPSLLGGVRDLVTVG